MSELKTQPNSADVEAFLANIDAPQKRADCQQLAQWMSELTGSPAQMWGSSIVGFGSYHYRYASGREGDWFLTGFAPRAQNISIYIMSGFAQFEALMQQLGKFKTGKSCLYIKRLSDIDTNILRQLLEASIRYLRETYATKAT